MFHIFLSLLVLLLPPNPQDASAAPGESELVLVKYVEVEQLRPASALLDIKLHGDELYVLPEQGGRFSVYDLELNHKRSFIPWEGVRIGYISFDFDDDVLVAAGPDSFYLRHGETEIKWNSNRKAMQMPQPGVVVLAGDKVVITNWPEPRERHFLRVCDRDFNPIKRFGSWPLAIDTRTLWDSDVYLASLGGYIVAAPAFRPVLVLYDLETEEESVIDIEIENGDDYWKYNLDQMFADGVVGQPKMLPVINGLAVDGGRIFVLCDQGETGFLILEFTPDGTLRHKYTFAKHLDTTTGPKLYSTLCLATAETSAGRRFIIGGNDLSSEYIVILRARQIATKH